MPRNSLHGHKPFQVVQMDFLEGIGPSGEEEEMRKKKKGEVSTLILLHYLLLLTHLRVSQDYSRYTIRVQTLYVDVFTCYTVQWEFQE